MGFVAQPSFFVVIHPKKLPVAGYISEVYNMKLGIIGTGGIVQEFLPYLASGKGLNGNGFDIVAILSSLRSLDKAKKICDDYGIESATCDFSEFCSSGIDTAYVAVPNAMHFEYCSKLLSRGLNVIVEKPMTSNYIEAQKLKQLALDNKCFLFEAITTVYLGNYLKIKEWLNRIGDIKLVQCEFNQYSRRYDAFRQGNVLPVFDPKQSGGALMDLNLYNFHFVMGLFGEPEEVRYYANIERGVDTSGVAVLRYPTFVASCVAAKDSKGWRGCVIQGTDGCITCEYPANYVGGVSLELNDGTKESYDDKGYESRAISEFEAFRNAIDNNDYEYCHDKLDESLQVAKILTRARKGAGIIFPADNMISD